MTWLVLQTLGYPVIPSVSTNLSGEFVRPCGTLGDELTIVSEAVKKGELGSVWGGMGMSSRASWP
jgi:hypothetical protein